MAQAHGGKWVSCTPPLEKFNSKSCLTLLTNFDYKVRRVGLKKKFCHLPLPRLERFAPLVPRCRDGSYRLTRSHGLCFLQGVLLLTLLSATVQGRRVGVKQAEAANDREDDAQSQQTAEEEEQQLQFKPLLISRRPLQQRPPVEVESERQPVIVVRQSPRLLQRPRDQAEDEEEHPPQVSIRQQPARSGLQQQRAQLPQQQLIQQRVKEQPQQQKEPTAQTIRNYNKLNDDGSFTFGYEADDGSFKEETRGTDCVVRGKYGYVDPDGNKREFSYVQGNPCDPNAVEDEEEQPLKPGEEENVPNVPINAPKPKPKPKNRPTTTLFQQTFGDFEQPQPQAVSTTPRQPGRQQQPLQDVSRRPSTITPPANIPSSTVAPVPQFQQSSTENDLESAIQNLPSGKSQLVPSGPNSPLYTTELVFDPATGQYNTVIFQQVPRQPTGIDVRQRLPAAPAPRQPQPQTQPQPPFRTQTPFQPHSPPQFGTQPQFRPALQPFQFQPQRPAEFDFQRPAVNDPQQQLVQQQQALTFQQSQNLFRQQQQKQQQMLQQPFQSQPSQFFPPSQRFATEPPQFAALPKQQRLEPQTDAHQQQFVLVQPGRTSGQQSLAAGQIDAFLRGHNVQF